MKIPIDIEKLPIRISETGNFAVFYEISLVEKGNYWKKTIKCNEKELIKLRNKINDLLENTTLAEKLGISNEDALKIEEYYQNDNLCKTCKYKSTNDCITCLFILQSPLERKLYLALKENYIRFQTQYALNWKGENISIIGKSYHNPTNNFKEVLTVPDFYIEKKNEKICIYTDGHTYHERTEEQAQRDKRIDRKLQELGFRVLRYTGKNVNENLNNIIQEIKKWISY